MRGVKAFFARLRAKRENPPAAMTVAPEAMQELMVGTIIQNHKGEWGVIVADENDPEKKAVLRLTEKQARKLIEECDLQGLFRQETAARDEGER